MSTSPSPARARTIVALAAILFAGAMVLLPSVRCPPILDDWLHAAMIDGQPELARSPFDLYDFVDDASRARWMERGLLPWWSHPRLRIRFLRPLSSALRFAEQRALGRAPLPLHLHSLLWWAAAVLATWDLLRRLLPRRAALLATAIFALGPWQVLPVGWLANREALVSLVFGALALAACVRFNERGKAREVLVATALFALSLLAGEYALCFAGYALALSLAPRALPLRRRVASLLAFALPAAAYLAVRAALGYGTRGSAFYVDPLGQPLAFLRVAPARLLTLLAEGWLSLGTSAWGTAARRWIVYALVALAAAPITIALRHTVATLDERTRRAALALLAGSLLALPPVLAVAPGPRLLGASAIGMAAAIAFLLDGAWFPVEERHDARARLAGLTALLLGFLHLVHGPAATWLGGRELRASSLAFAASARALGERLPDPSRAEVAVVRGAAGMFFGPFAIDPRGRPPLRWRILAHAGHVLALRTDERTLELRAPSGQGVYPIGPSNLFRSDDAPLAAGATVELPGLRVEVLEADADGPRRVRYVFDRALDDPSLAFVAEGATGFRDAEPPAVGYGAPFDP